MNTIRIAAIALFFAACSEPRDPHEGAEATPDVATEITPTETLEPLEVAPEMIADTMLETREDLDTTEPDVAPDAPEVLTESDTSDTANAPDVPEPRTCERLAPPEVIVGQPLGTVVCNAEEPCDPNEVFVPDFAASFDGSGEPGLVGDGYHVDPEDFSYGMYQGGPAAGGQEVTVELAFSIRDAVATGCMLTYDGRTYFAISSSGLGAHAYGPDGELMSASVPLSGLPPRSWDYFADDAWHHVALTVDTRTGRMRFYIDGVTSPELETTNTPISGLVAFDWLGYGARCDGWLVDEVRFYPRVLPSALIAEHAAAVLSGQPYPDQSTCGPVPCAPSTYDPSYAREEFAIEGADGFPTQDALTQLADYPLPRYREGHTLHRLESWVQALWLSADNDLVTDANTPDSRAVKLMQAIAVDWHYYFDITHAGCLGIEYDWCLDIVSAFVDEHPEIPLLMQTYGAVADTSAYMAKERPACPSGLNPMWSADTFYDIAFDYYLTWVSLAKDRLGRPLDLIVEDGETWWEGRQWGGPPLGEEAILACADVDPEALTTYQGYLDRGLSARHMWTDAFTRWRLAWNDALRDLNGDPDTDILWYGIDGYFQWNAGDWGLGARDIQMSTIPQTFGGERQRYSSIDFYPISNTFDRTQGPHHGLDWVFAARSGEIAAGDHLFWPFVAAGWSYEEYNTRPGTWLGLMKILAGLGAESYHAGYFAYPPHSPGGDWVWHAVIPAYAQAITSQWEDILRSSVVVAGRQRANPRHVYVVRQVLDGNGEPLPKWLVIGNVNRFTQTADALNSKDSTMNVQLGDATVRLPIRMQGSTYIYDATGPEPTLVQLDAWHEWTHPSWWSKDFAFEAEAADAGSGRIVTRWPEARQPEAIRRPEAPQPEPIRGPEAVIRDGVRAVTVRELGPGESARFAFEPRQDTRFEPWARIETTGPATIIVRIGDDEQRLIVPHAQALRWTQLGVPFAIAAGPSVVELEVVEGNVTFDAARLVVEGGPTRCD